MDTVRLRPLRPVVVLAALAGAAGVCAAPVALVTDVVGAGTQRDVPLRLLAEVEAGSEISVADGGRVVLFYLADGAEWTLSGRGRYRLGARAPQPDADAPAPRRKAAPGPLVAVKLGTDRTVQGGLQMRGGGDRPVLVAPVDETLLDGDVEFKWTPAGAGTMYRFELVDAAGAKVHVTETEASTLRLPQDVALAAGTVYLWAIGGRDPNTPQPFYRAAEFRVADAVTHERLRVAQPPPDAPFADRVLYVALLERAGAKSAARALRTTLAAERPAAWASPK